MSEGLSIWTIYDHPLDYPDKFVARCSIGTTPTSSVMLADDLEALRRVFLTEMGLTMLTRSPEDDPVIVEVWL